MRSITRLIALMAIPAILLLGLGSAGSAQTAVPTSHHGCISTPGAYISTQWVNTGWGSGYTIVHCNVVVNHTAVFPAGGDANSSWTVGVAASTYVSTTSQGSFGRSTTYGEVVSCMNPEGHAVGGQAMQKNPHCQNPFG
jgi:hypothetical protein